MCSKIKLIIENPYSSLLLWVKVIAKIGKTCCFLFKFRITKHVYTVCIQNVYTIYLVKPHYSFKVFKKKKKQMKNLFKSLVFQKQIKLP